MNNNNAKQKSNKTIHNKQSGYFNYKKVQQNAKNIEIKISEIEEQIQELKTFVDINLDIDLLKNINENILKEIPEESGKKLFEKENLLKIALVNKNTLLLLRQISCFKYDLDKISQDIYPNAKDNLDKTLQDICQNAIEILTLIEKSNYILRTIKQSIAKILTFQENQNLSEEDLNEQRDTKKSSNVKLAKRSAEKEEQFILEIEEISKTFNTLYDFISMKETNMQEQINNAEDHKLPETLKQKIKETDQLLISITETAVYATQRMHGRNQTKSAILQTKINKEILTQNIETLHKIHNITQELIKTMWEYKKTHKIHQISIYQTFYQTICVHIQDILELITIADNVSNEIKNKTYIVYLTLIIKEKCTITRIISLNKKITQDKVYLKTILDAIDELEAIGELNAVNNQEINIKDLEKIKDDLIALLKWNISQLDKEHEQRIHSPSVSKYCKKLIHIIKNDIQNIEQIYKNYCDYKETQKQKNQDTTQTTDSEQEKAEEAIAPETLIGDSEQEKAGEAIAIMPEIKLSDTAIEKIFVILEETEICP